MPYPTGPGTPIVVAPGDVSIDLLALPPLEIQHIINDFPSSYFIADTLLSQDTAPSGVVLYNQLSDLDLYIDSDAQRQPTDVNPGDEFPAVDVLDRVPAVAVTVKNGAYFAVTDEDARRSKLNVIQEKLRRLKNNLTLISNTKMVNAILTDPTVVASCTTATVGIWNGTNNPLLDVSAAQNQVDNETDLGYDSDFGMLHPDAMLILQNYLATTNFTPREDASLNPLFNKSINGLKNLKWIVSKRVPRTKMIIGQSNVVGTLVSEIPPFTEVIPERKRQRTVVLSGRQEVTVIDQPYAVHVTTGIIT